MISRCSTTPSGAVHKALLVAVEKGELDIEAQTVTMLDAARTHMVSSAIRGDKGKIIFRVEDGALV